MAFFSFGKKKRSKKSGKGRVQRKPPAALLKRCRKYRIKTTVRKGGKRVYRKASLLKKLLKRKMKRKLKKGKTVKRRSGFGAGRSARRGRRSGFGSSLQGYSFENPGKYGFDQTVKQYPQTLSQTNSVVDAKMNISRPDGLQLGSSDLPIYGVYRDFFGQEVPAQVPPSYNFMGQPDGTLFPVGAPFNTYKSPMAFGRRRRGRRAFGNTCEAGMVWNERRGKCAYERQTTGQRLTEIEQKHLGYGRRRRGARAFGGGLMYEISNYDAAKKRFNERKEKNKTRRRRS